MLYLQAILFNLSGKREGQSIEMYDGVGDKVFSGKVGADGRVDAAGLGTGEYFLRFDGKEISPNVKVIKLE